MKKFGYFGKPSETEALLTEEAVIYGLMKVQRFVGLPQTGRLDFETIKILNTPRCGNPDLPQESSVLKPRRQKRFVLGSNGWEKRKLTYFVANWTPKLQNETFVKSELKRAFQMWADYSGLEFSLSNDYYNSDIIILFGRYFLHFSYYEKKYYHIVYSLVIKIRFFFFGIIFCIFFGAA